MTQRILKRNLLPRIYYSPKRFSRQNKNNTIIWFNINSEKYCILHKKLGPAKIYLKYFCNEWYRHDFLHRIDGPAIVKKLYVSWWWNDFNVEEENYWNK